MVPYYYLKSLLILLIGILLVVENEGRSLVVKRAASDTPKCNSITLKDYMERNINESPSESKRAIQKAAMAGIGGTFDVFCSSSDFSYLVTTRLYCETQINSVTCFAFLHD